MFFIKKYNAWKIVLYVLNCKNCLCLSLTSFLFKSNSTLISSSLLNEKIITKLSNINGIKINKTKYTIPHIISISFDTILAETLSNILSANEIYVNVNLNNEISSSVMAIYNDLNRCKQTMRISLSHLTTLLEINRFLEIFELEYIKLNNLIGSV